MNRRPILKQGEYELSYDMSHWEIFKLFKEGKVRSFKVSFPEGFNHYEMAQVLKNNNYPDTEKFLELVWDKDFIKDNLSQNLNSLEGYLFPDTYQITKYMPAEDLIRSMLDKFLAVYEELNKSPLEVKLNQHEVITLASIVEKETSIEEERPLIAGVFFNRLKKKHETSNRPYHFILSLFRKRL